jgi:hypothetical protein
LEDEDVAMTEHIVIPGLKIGKVEFLISIEDCQFLQNEIMASSSKTIPQLVIGNWILHYASVYDMIPATKYDTPPEWHHEIEKLCQVDFSCNLCSKLPGLYLLARAVMWP